MCPPGVCQSEDSATHSVASFCLSASGGGSAPAARAKFVYKGRAKSPEECSAQILSRTVPPGGHRPSRLSPIIDDHRARRERRRTPRADVKVLRGRAFEWIGGTNRPSFSVITVLRPQPSAVCPAVKSASATKSPPTSGRSGSGRTATRRRAVSGSGASVCSAPIGALRTSRGRLLRGGGLSAVLTVPAPSSPLSSRSRRTPSPLSS